MAGGNSGIALPDGGACCAAAALVKSRASSVVRIIIATAYPESDI
jgi:hypothetical protein